ncbi:MAG TPA: winged helix-turn-helix transcriptional regulator [Gemmatimonadales bacterium]|nr:winged helix-turn-helix transcriptional regulator [Gemmatimonadales bacterium]
MDFVGQGQGIALPRGYRGPRGAILVELKRAGPAAARELAQKVGLSLNAVRHHLKELEADGLVEYRREQRGPGAPTFAYALTAAGEALFPQRYQETLTDLLEQLAERHGREAALDLLRARYERLARRLKAELEGQPFSARVAAVARARLEDGFMAEWSGADRSFRLTEHHCSVRAVAERFPELCAIEAAFLEEVLGGRVERTLHILGGCSACGYRITFGPGDDAPAASGGTPEAGVSPVQGGTA